VLRSAPRPFLKWVGGKRQLLPVLRRYYPRTIGTYFEPFLGSAAVFFDLAGRGTIAGSRVVLSDANVDLIACYQAVRRTLPEVIDELERLATDHVARGRTAYLEVRDQRFNPRRAEWRAAGADLAAYPPELAAMLIYLNRTGYNGLFRLNASGEFNVPPGRYDSPRVLNRAVLTEAARLLSNPGVTIERGGFAHMVQSAQRGDFVYFDPPYAPVSHTANFRGYTGHGFSDQQQAELRTLVIALAERGVTVLLSNSSAASVRALYEDSPECLAAGVRAWTVPARRAVNSRPDRRGTVDELVVSNMTPADG